MFKDGLELKSEFCLSDCFVHDRWPTYSRWWADWRNGPVSCWSV